MFYRPADGHGLPHNPFNAMIAPRPIAWVSTRDAMGHDNLAPYSFFNGIAYVPPQVMFASTGHKPDRTKGKDSLSNIEETGVFCVNLVEASAQNVMNASSETLPAGQDEFAAAQVPKGACSEINAPRVLSAPASLECRMTQIVESKGAHNYVVFGEVVGVHIRDDCLVNGKFDVTQFGLLSRLGYRDYTVVREAFELSRPDD
ncbi:MAG: flavin reductase family protein [Maritimibacter sp.]